MARQQSTTRSTKKSTSLPTRSNSTATPTHTKVPVSAVHSASVNQIAPVGGQSQGLFSRIAETATGVAIGHVVGRAITGTASFFTNSNSPALDNAQLIENTNRSEPLCQEQLAQFLSCIDRNGHGDSYACSHYQELLTQCRAGSSANSQATDF